MGSQASFDGADDDVGFADADLVAFAAHVFEEDAQVHEAAAGDGEFFGGGARVDAEGDVAFEFLAEAVADLAAGDVLAVAAGEGAVVDAEGHGHCGFVDGDGGQARGAVGAGDGVADFDGVEA